MAGRGGPAGPLFGGFRSPHRLWYPHPVSRGNSFAVSMAAAVLALFSRPAGVSAEEFAYKHHVGDKFRILATSVEDVYLDGELASHAEILNRIATEVTAMSGDAATVEALFQVAEQGTGGTDYHLAQEERSVFTRDSMGRLTVARQYYQPTVRNVPYFPGRSLSPGEGWVKDGVEVHDLRPFGVEAPYEIPFKANYRYVGLREWRGREYPAFTVSYTLLKRQQLTVEEAPGLLMGQTRRTRPGERVAPVSVTRASGESRETVYWDPETGQPAASDGNFTLKFEFSDGREAEFRGVSHGEVIEAETMNREDVAAEIEDEIERLGLDGAEVKITPEGVTISIEDIQFAADSARLLPGEQQKLDKIAGILRRYQDRDILVSGHTALAGTAAERQRLSEERASAVAGYLIGEGVRQADRVMTRGFGAERPVADNRTEAGKRKNRRVEITILEN